MAIFKRKSSAATSPAIPPCPTVALDRGALTLAQQLAGRLSLDATTRDRLEQELQHFARAGWERQVGLMSVPSTAHRAQGLDESALYAAAKDLFDNSRLTGLAGDLSSDQHAAVLRVFPLLGLATYDAASNSLIVKGAGGIGIFESLGALHHVLFREWDEADDSRAAFVAATDSVMWGAAVAVAQLGGPVLAGGHPTPPSAPLIEHVLSFSEVNPAFDAQEAIFDGIKSVADIQFTNSEKVPLPRPLVFADRLGEDGGDMVGEAVMGAR
ncbi:MAG: hypothetical protein H0W25_05410 [Acidimicrobiia bacterium]|nr:hypothetical protein [Acidimicrobiia bacterium]